MLLIFCSVSREKVLLTHTSYHIFSPQNVPLATKKSVFVVFSLFSDKVRKFFDNYLKKFCIHNTFLKIFPKNVALDT